MAKITSFIYFFILIRLIPVHGQSTTTSNGDDDSDDEIIDATQGGKSGSPGAQIRFSTTALDTIYTHSLTKIAESIKSMFIPDVIVPIGGGMLTIKNTKINEASFEKFERQSVPPNRLRSRFSGGRITSVGQWAYKPMGQTRTIAQGLFRTVIYNAELSTTTSFSRTWDEKPSVQTSECKANLGQFRVEIEGFGDNTTTIDQCNNLLCSRIRAYFEDSVCNTARNYIKETIGQKLSTFPVKTNLGCTGNRYVLNYGLLNGEPKVNENFIQAYLEAEVQRGTTSAPFYPNELKSTEFTQRMISFPCSDFAFNSLFHHAHQQQHRFSAHELLPTMSTLRNLLKFNCQQQTNPVEQRRTKGGYRLQSVENQKQSCLGSIFDNTTIGQYPTDATGDLVFKSQRPLQVMVRRSPQQHWFGQSNSNNNNANNPPARSGSAANNVGGSIEAYGPVGADGKRELLVKADVQKLFGEFNPKMSGCNITGSVNVSSLQLTQSSQQLRHRSLDDPVLSQLSQLSMPILAEMFNIFLQEFAQFPLPLLDGYECVNPELMYDDRTIQMDADVRVLEHATRKTTKSG
jgi:hypothetical protein